MKPLVYFNDFKPYDDDYVMVENKRLQEIFNEIYDAGFDDGKKFKNWQDQFPILTKTNIMSEPSVTLNTNIGQPTTNAAPIAVYRSIMDASCKSE